MVSEESVQRGWGLLRMRVGRALREEACFLGGFAVNEYRSPYYVALLKTVRFLLLPRQTSQGPPMFYPTRMIAEASFFLLNTTFGGNGDTGSDRSGPSRGNFCGTSSDQGREIYNTW